MLALSASGRKLAMKLFIASGEAPFQQAGHHAGERTVHEAGADTDAELGDALAAERLDLAGRVPDVGQHDPRVADQRLSIGGGAHAARQPLEQRHAEELLEPPQAHAESGLRDVAGRGGGPQRALVDGGHQVLELAYLHNGSLYIMHNMRIFNEVMAG